MRLLEMISPNEFAKILPDVITQLRYDFSEEQVTPRKVKQALSKFMSAAETQNDMIKVYRKVNADRSWYPSQWKTKPLGVYWSYDKGAANSHWGEANTGVWEIVALAPIKSIDWVTTLSHQIVFDGEREVRLNQGTQIQVINLSFAEYVGGDYYGIEELTDEDFSPVTMEV